jgi:hypothetical protein
MMRPKHQPPHAWTSLIALACWAVSLGGCGDNTIPPLAEADQARPILTTALETWKRGEKPDGLLSGQPSIRVIDHEWQTGWTLSGYELKGEGQRHGVAIRQGVALDLKNPKGKSIKKTTFYHVNTGSPAVITREDLDGD